MNDRFLICAAYWIIAERYHSGQNSKGYRKLSQLHRMGFKPGFGRLDLDPEARDYAAALLWKRRREIRKEW